MIENKKKMIFKKIIFKIKKMQDSSKLKEIFSNINKHFEFIICDIWDRKDLFIECGRAIDYDDYIKRFSILCELIKDLLKKIEDGELDISNFIFPIEYIFNISEVKSSLSYYKGFIKYCHGIWGKDKYNKNLIDIYEKHFQYLNLLLSKMKFENYFEKLESLLPKERLYLKEEYVLKVCGSVIKMDPISSKYPTLEEHRKLKEIENEN